MRPPAEAARSPSGRRRGAGAACALRLLPATLAVVGAVGHGSGTPTTTVRASSLTGVIRGWGLDDKGQIDGIPGGDVTAPTDYTHLSGLTAVADGEGATAGLTSLGTVWMWGSEGQGRLGNGVSSDSGVLTTATQVHGVGNMGGLSGVKAINGQGSRFFALQQNGTLVAWGGNQYGEIGDGTIQGRSVPVVVPGLPSVAAVNCSWTSSIAVGTDGSVWTWGSESGGRLGDGVTSGMRTSPFHVPGVTSAVGAAISNHALVLRSDGTVIAWGDNRVGELGDGTTTNRLAPVVVAGLTNVRSVSSTDDTSAALKNDGTVWVWGGGADGELGTGSPSHVTRPQQVPGLSNIVALVLHSSHLLALTGSGAVYAWGVNGHGEAGGDPVGTNTMRPALRVASGAIALAAAPDASHVVVAAGGTTPPPAPKPTSVTSAPPAPSAGGGPAAPDGGQPGVPAKQSVAPGTDAARGLSTGVAPGGDAGGSGASNADPTSLLDVTQFSGAGALVPVSAALYRGGPDAAPGLIAGAMLERHPLVSATLAAVAMLLVIAGFIVTSPREAWGRIRARAPRRRA
jgi:alpha-tubulin suppressor-like RCC1 family protein